MRVDVLQVEYGQLDEIAQRFKLLHEGICTLTASLHGAYQPLDHGDWCGQGSQAFFTTMATKLFPAFERLELALQAGLTTIMQVSHIMRQAEVEAAAVFQGDVQPIPATSSQTSGGGVVTNGTNLQEEATTPTEEGKETPEEFTQRAISMIIEAIKNWSLAHDNRNGIVSPAQAQTLFDTMASQPDIPFNFKDNGCYARAQIMIDRMAQSGPLKLEQFEKAYVTGDLHVVTDQPYDAVTMTRDDGTVVSYDKQNSHDGILDWTYHIAPLVYVRQPDGSIAEMIIDPSLADKPITRQEWEALMGGPDAILDSNVVDHTWYGILSPEDQASSDEEYQQNSENALKELDVMLGECQDRGYCK